MRELIRIKGVDDLFTLITFLEDKPKFKAHMDKMEALRKELNDNVRAVGKISEMDTFKAQAQSDRQMAREELAKAKAAAGAVIADADEIKKRALAATRKAKQQDDALTLRERAIKDAQAIEDQKLKDREVAAAKAVSSAEAALAKSKSVMEEALKVKAEYESRVDTLESALRVASG